MSLISTPRAIAHLRLAPDYPTDQVDPYISAAEQAGMAYLNRRVYSDAETLDAARLTVPAKLAAAAEARRQAFDVAAAHDDVTVRIRLREMALATYADAITEAEEIHAGIVMSPAIEAGFLVLLSHAFRTRDPETGAPGHGDWPLTALSWLMPWRARMGV